MDFNLSPNESGKMGLVWLELFNNSQIELSLIENNCTEVFAEQVDNEVVIEKHTFDGFNVSKFLFDTSYTLLRVHNYTLSCKMLGLSRWYFPELLLGYDFA